MILPFRLTFDGIPGLTYRIERTADLTFPIEWSPVGSATADARGVVTYVDEGGSGSHFYRLAYP